MPDTARALAGYDRELRRLVRRGLTIQAKDLVRIRRRFDAFRRATLAAVPQRFPMNQAAIAGVLQSLRGPGRRARPRPRRRRRARDEGAGRADRGARPGVRARRRHATAEQEYGASARPGPRLLGRPDRAASGRLRADILRDVNRVLRLSALGAGAGGYAGADVEVAQAMTGIPQWTAAAEHLPHRDGSRPADSPTRWCGRYTPARADEQALDLVRDLARGRTSGSTVRR